MTGISHDNCVRNYPYSTPKVSSERFASFILGNLEWVPLINGSAVGENDELRPRAGLLIDFRSLGIGREKRDGGYLREHARESGSAYTFPEVPLRPGACINDSGKINQPHNQGTCESGQDKVLYDPAHMCRFDSQVRQSSGPGISNHQCPRKRSQAGPETVAMQRIDSVSIFVMHYVSTAYTN